MDDGTQKDLAQEVVEAVPPEDSVDQIPSAVRSQLSIESLIKSFISRAAKIKEDLKPASEMLSDLLNNNEEYHVAAEEAKEASKKKSAVKKETTFYT